MLMTAGATFHGLRRKVLAKIILQNLVTDFILLISAAFCTVSTLYILLLCSAKTPPTGCHVLWLPCVPHLSSPHPPQSLTVGFLKILSILSPLLFCSTYSSWAFPPIPIASITTGWIVGCLNANNDTSGSPKPGGGRWVYLETLIQPKQ